MSDAKRDPVPPKSARPRWRLRNIALGMIVGAAVAIAGVIAVISIVAARDRLPAITAEILDAAGARWASQGPADYEMDLELSGVNPGAVHVEVRGGEVSQMTLNGRPTRQHLWDDWSVPGLLVVIRRDLEVCMAQMSGAKAAGTGEAGAPQAEPVVPRGIFDAHYGYPAAYHRVTPTGADAKWRVTKFTPR